MRVINIVLAGVLAFSAFACSTDVEPPPGPDSGVVPDFCPDTRRICADDTICMGGSMCRPAFDRDYELRLDLFAPGMKKCGEDRDCPLSPVTVHYSEADGPILDSRHPHVAAINVIEDSFLVIDIQNDECVVPLTSDRLRGGRITCTRGGLTASVMLDAMPHPSDGEAPQENQ